MPEVLPTISVTKPPAPLPVGLPTADDLVAISDSMSSDLEAGVDVDLAMREVGNALPAVSKSPVSPTSTLAQSPQTEKLPSPLPPPPASPNQTPTRTVFTPDTIQSPPSAADLLGDSSNSLASVAVEPLVATPPEEPQPQPQSPPSPTTSAESPVLVHNEDALPPSTNSIRLVGTGGATGSVGEEPISSDGVLVSEPEEVAEPLPASKPSSPEPQERGRHEKKKSLSAGLKKLGNLGGGKRRTDSVSSQKSQKSVKH